MARIKRYSYIVFFDSSSLYGEPIARQVRELIESHKDDDRVAIKIYIPEVVAKELERKLLVEIPTRHKQALKSIKYLRTFFPDISSDIPETIDTKLILEARSRVLTELGIEIVPTPIHTIDWQNIIDRATRYDVPFEEAHEKGFKDALIVETAINHFLASARKSVYAFVGNDVRMNQYLAEKTEKYAKFNIFDSVPALSTDIQLRLDESTSKIVDAVKESARKAFYENGNKQSLYNSNALENKLNHELDVLVRSDEFSKRYPIQRIVRKSKLSNIEIASPVFLERPDKTTFHWQSIILGDAELITQRLDELVTRTNTLKLEFKVNWNAVFTKKGVVMPKKMSVRSVILSSYDLRSPLIIPGTSLRTITQAYEDMTKQLTTIGQPTLPIDSINEAMKQAQSSTASLSEVLRRLQGINNPKKSIDSQD